MPSTWSIITQTTTSWVSVTEGGDDWLDPRMTLLATEDDANIRLENDGFLATEAVPVPASSSWVAA
jgi:hypothetical protein